MDKTHSSRHWSNCVLFVILYFNSIRRTLFILLTMWTARVGYTVRLMSRGRPEYGLTELLLNVPLGKLSRVRYIVKSDLQEPYTTNFRAATTR